MKMTIIACSLLIALGTFCDQAAAQNVENFRSLDLRYGRTGLPGDIFKLVGECYLAPGVNFALGGFLETSNRNSINYDCYGLDAMAYYYSPVGDRTDNRFQVRLGLGATADYEQEKHLYQKLSTSQKINTGIVGELAGEWAFTSDFSLLLAYNQKAMFSKDLGTYRFDISIGCKIKFF
jgi:hypothetical protein